MAIALCRPPARAGGAGPAGPETAVTCAIAGAYWHRREEPIQRTASGLAGGVTGSGIVGSMPSIAPTFTPPWNGASSRTLARLSQR